MRGTKNLIQLAGVEVIGNAHLGVQCSTRIATAIGQIWSQKSSKLDSYLGKRDVAYENWGDKVEIEKIREW